LSFFIGGLMPVGAPPGALLAFELLAFVVVADGAGAVVVVVVVVLFLSGVAVFWLELSELHPVQRAAMASRASGAKGLRIIVSPIGNGVALRCSSASSSESASGARAVASAALAGRGRDNKARLR
jgi:hypothetical protein